MPRTGENIRKRKDGRWEARVFDGLKYKSIYAHSYSEIKEKKKQYDNNNLITDHNYRFDKAANNWLISIKSNIKNSTYARYTFILERYIFPYIGSLRISTINKNTINIFTNKLLQSGSLRRNTGLSNKTVNDILSVIKNVLNYHYDTYNINANPIKIKYTKIDNNKTETFTDMDIAKMERIFKENNNPFIIGITLSLYLGMRIGEVCALKWSDIDLKSKIVHVDKTMQRISINHTSRIIIDKPKTTSSNRIIPIPNFLVDYLKTKKQNDNYYVLTNSFNWLEPRVYYNRYKQLLKKYNITNYSYHTLRHTFATRCIDSGFDIKTLSEILGHSNIDVTLRIYVHPTLNMKRKAMNKIKADL